MRSLAESDELTLSAGDLRVVIRPRFGGHIPHFTVGDREILAQGSPRTDHVVRQKDFVRSGMGGLDDCLPTIAPVSDFEGAPVVSHGEVWYRPTAVEEVSSSAVALSIQGEHAPYTLRRIFRLDQEKLEIDYEIENFGDHSISVLWAAHPLFSPSPGCFLDLPKATWRVYFSSFAQKDTLLRSLQARLGDQQIDLGNWDAIPDGTYAKLFTPWPSGQAVTLQHPSWRVAIAVTCEGAPIPGHLGLWLNRFGFPSNAPLSHIAIEPTFGSGDDLESVIQDGTCLKIPAGGSASWRVAYWVVAPSGMS